MLIYRPMRKKTVLLFASLGLFGFMIIFQPDINKNTYGRFESKENFNATELYKRIKEYMYERKQLINGYCDKHVVEKNMTYGIEKRLIIDWQNEITWCPIFKAGSTVWMKIFADIAKALNDTVDLTNESKMISDVVREAFPHPKTIKNVSQALNTTFKFIVVRHPFERLLSAFRDKIETISKKFYYKKFGELVLKKYRKGYDNTTVPLFEEFLKFVVTEKVFDEHWRPYYIECSPCYINYDMIIKMETLKNDKRYFIDHLRNNIITKACEKDDEKDTWKNINLSGRTDVNVTVEYFSKIPLTILKDVYSLYERDFIMFDYSPDWYFDLAKQT